MAINILLFKQHIVPTHYKALRRPRHVCGTDQVYLGLANGIGFHAERTDDSVNICGLKSLCCSANVTIVYR